MVERAQTLNCSSKSELLNSSLKDQQNSYRDWLAEDTQLIGQHLISQTFAPNSEIILTNWKSKVFHEEGDYDFCCRFLGNWHDVDARNCEDGLLLKGKVMQLPCSLNLRALALDIKIRLKLSFHSSFYVFLRVVDGITIETPVLKILKDANLRGLFFVFANIDPVSNKFKFIKQNQIPETAAQDGDVKELELGIIDNGNDQVFVSVKSVGKVQSVKSVNFVCNGFLPEVRDSKMWIAGIGDGVFVRSVSVQYRERIMTKPRTKKSPDCVCTVF